MWALKIHLMSESAINKSLTSHYSHQKQLKCITGYSTKILTNQFINQYQLEKYL